MSDENANKKILKREKSALYPYYGLKDSLDFAKKVQKLAGKGITSEQALAAELGVSTTTKSFKYNISSTRQFGLIFKTKEGVQITERARNILNPVDLKEVPSIKQESLQIPPLYKIIIKKYEGMELPSEASLANLIYNDHRIAGAVKDRAAKIFIESARFSNAIDESGKLILGNIDQYPNENNTNEEKQEPQEIGEDIESIKENRLTEERMSSYGTVELALSGSRIVKLIYPADLNSNEVERIKKLVDLLVVED